MKLCCEDVLYSFAVEPDSNRSTLAQYLRDYPQYAAQLIDLSYELLKEVCEDETPLSDEDEALINKSWQKYNESNPTNSAAEAEN